MYLYKENQVADIYIEDNAFSGVKRIAEKLAHDVELVVGHRPKCVTGAIGTGQKPECVTGAIDTETNQSGASAVWVGTIGSSRMLDVLEQKGVVDLSQIRGKREVYGWFFLSGGGEAASSQILVIAGSDKRGTIYGMFHLSEVIGVSPFVDWCGTKPAKKDSILLDESMAVITKEPSVKYRGFFINDEWPAFGNWCDHHFGGFNAKAYEHVFELLLRLKGNYLWPAMWSGRFEDDGPGLLNAELADEYGVVMGMSHHEPCLRQGEEYKYLRGKDSIYGDAWNFRTNREGIIRFWEDGLKRSGRFENVITVGMRGEADTAILGKGATLADNIELLGDVLRTQRRLIQENVNEDLTKVPRMIALYKEVEEFFYGREGVKGLMGSEELEDVILMLCDDNYGNLRTLPTEEMRKHRGGYGMYYHFDYHGWPISYEWINSSYLPKVWEQMTQAYEFGVRDLWIVNVGDIATQEYPLSYFLDLAYDFDKWGSRAMNSTRKYTKEWVQLTFGCLRAEQQEEIVELLQGYTGIIQKRRPEAMNADVYHPVNYHESYRTLVVVEDYLKRAEALYGEVAKLAPENLSSFVALVYYPAMGTLNVTKMQIMAGLNHYLAKLGALRANDYGKAVKACLAKDRELVDLYQQMDDKRWYGMGMSQHIGFVNWNEDECQNPVIMQVLPVNKPRLVATVDGTTQHVEGSPWLPNEMELREFLNPDCTEAAITVLSQSNQPAAYQVLEKPDWLCLNSMEGTVDGKNHNREQLRMKVDRRLAGEAVLSVNSKGQGIESEAAEKNTFFKIIQGIIRIQTPAGECVIHVPVCVGTFDYPENTYVNTQGYIAIEAEHYFKKTAGARAEFACIHDYGKTRSAMKAFPTTEYFTPGEDAPYLEYHFAVEEEQVYEAELYMQPSNPVTTENNLCYAIQANNGDIRTYNVIKEGFQVGDQGHIWAAGVLNQIRTHTSRISCVRGVNILRIYPVTPGVVLEKLVIYPLGHRPAESYLGPTETYRCM